MTAKECPARRLLDDAVAPHRERVQAEAVAAMLAASRNEVQSDLTYWTTHAAVAFAGLETIGKAADACKYSCHVQRHSNACREASGKLNLWMPTWKLP